jgi:5-hydroxyisourate hydrolase
VLLDPHIAGLQHWSWGCDRTARHNSRFSAVREIIDKPRDIWRNFRNGCVEIEGKNMSGFLTTHVLDTASGQPAAGMAIDLYRLEGDTRAHIVSMVTNDDGRTDSPILPTGEFKVGRYELVFQAGAYFGRDEDPSFLDDIPLRFGISDAASHYHVPLLVSPFSFSTYRGS